MAREAAKGGTTRARIHFRTHLSRKLSRISKVVFLGIAWGGLAIDGHARSCNDFSLRALHSETRADVQSCFSGIPGEGERVGEGRSDGDPHSYKILLVCLDAWLEVWRSAGSEGDTRRIVQYFARLPGVATRRAEWKFIFHEPKRCHATSRVD